MGERFVHEPHPELRQLNMSILFDSETPFSVGCTTCGQLIPFNHENRLVTFEHICANPKPEIRRISLDDLL